MSELSVIIPNRNNGSGADFTQKTVDDILRNAGCDVEVIVNVDEKWPELSTDKRVTYIHPSSPQGMREGINKGVELARGKYIMKCDDHVAFGENFGRILIDAHQDNWVQIPRRYALDAENWKIEEGNSKYPIDYMYIDFPLKGKAHDDGMHGVPWKRPERKDMLIDDTPSMQGSCYFMTKDYFNKLGLMSEVGYGQFSQESQEIGFKTWLSGGEVKVNKNTWYAHLYKGNRYGRMYKVDNFNDYTKKASEWSASHWLNNEEPNMVHSFSWFINEKFSGMPTWPLGWEQLIKEMGWMN